MKEKLDVQKLLRKAYEDRLDRQPEDQPEAKRKAAAASELDELLGPCWRKHAKPEAGAEYFSKEEVTAKGAPEELTKERKDQEFYDKLGALFSKAPVGHPAAPKEAGLPDAKNKEDTIAQITVLLGKL